jgi:hypothetical protein
MSGVGRGEYIGGSRMYAFQLLGISLVTVWTLLHEPVYFEAQKLTVYSSPIPQGSVYKPPQ